MPPAPGRRKDRRHHRPIGPHRRIDRWHHQIGQCSAKLTNGTAELANGTTKLANASAKLTNGTAELANTAAELTDGTAELSDAAADLSNAANGSDAADLSNAADAAETASNERVRRRTNRNYEVSHWIDAQHFFGSLTFDRRDLHVIAPYQIRGVLGGHLRERQAYRRGDGHFAWIGREDHLGVIDAFDQIGILTSLKASSSMRMGSFLPFFSTTAPISPETL